MITNPTVTTRKFIDDVEVVNYRDITRLVGVSSGAIRSWLKQSDAPAIYAITADGRAEQLYNFSEVLEWAATKIPEYVARRRRGYGRPNKSA